MATLSVQTGLIRSLTNFLWGYVHLKNQEINCLEMQVCLVCSKTQSLIESRFTCNLYEYLAFAVKTKDAIVNKYNCIKAVLEHKDPCRVQFYFFKQLKNVL